MLDEVAWKQGVSSSLFGFPLLFIIPPLLRTHVLPLLKVRDGPHHILGLEVGCPVYSSFCVAVSIGDFTVLNAELGRIRGDAVVT